MTGPIRVLTVDEDLPALRRLSLLLQAIPDVAHVGEAQSCAQARKQIDDLNPDALLLEVRMPDGNAFEIVRELAQMSSPPSAIIVTAFDHFAVRAFEGAVLDYLLKPVERERLASALNRVRRQKRAELAEQRIDAMQEVIQTLRSAAAGREAEPYVRELWVRGGNGLVRVPVETIECASSQDDYVALHTTSCDAHLMRGSIRWLEAHLEPGLFLRVHKSWMVRRAAITNIRTTRAGPKVLLRSGREVPAGRVYLKKFRNTLKIGEPTRFV